MLALLGPVLPRLDVPEDHPIVISRGRQPDGQQKAWLTKQEAIQKTLPLVNPEELHLSLGELESTILIMDRIGSMSLMRIGSIYEPDEYGED